MKTQLAQRSARKFGVEVKARFVALHAGSRTILLISNDRQLDARLRSFANGVGLLVIRSERTMGTIFIVQATKPIAVLLDLDLADKAAWETAELVLREPECPTVVLLTGRTEKFDPRTAVRVGWLVSKSEAPSRVFEIIEEAMELPAANHAERNAIQRVLIQRLRPFELAESTAPAHRFWGINE